MHSKNVQFFSNVRLRAKGVVEAAGAEVVEGVVFVDLDVEKPFFTKRLREAAPGAVPASGPSSLTSIVKIVGGEGERSSGLIAVVMSLLATGSIRSRP